MTSKLFKFLNSAAGFSLPEVMIGGGILAGIALASAHLFKDQKFSQKKIEHEQKLTVYHQNLAKTLNIPANCNATLKQYVSSNSSIANQDISTLYTCSGGCKDLNLLGNKGIFDAYTAGSYVGAPLISVGQFTDKSELWRIESMKLKGRGNTGTVVLKVQYKLNPKLSNTKTVSKDITLSTRFSGGNFKECLNSQESSIDNLQSDLCKSLNMNIDSVGSNGLNGNVASDGRMARWDDETQTCIVDGSKDCSSQPGMQVDGMGSDGVVRCKPIFKAGDASNLQNQNPAACGAGKPQLIYNKATKTMSIQCI